MTLLDYRMVKKEDIPKIPLYMDQVTGYLDEVLDGVRRNGDEKTLTKTMINNYVKSGLIESPEKKYNRDQLMSLIMIYFLKASTQIQEIDTLLTAFDDTSLLYSRFSTILDEELSRFEAVEKEDALDEILRLLISSSLQKKYAERLIDQFLE